MLTLNEISSTCAYIIPQLIISHNDIWTSFLATLSATDELLTGLLWRGAYLYQLINFAIPCLCLCSVLIPALIFSLCFSLIARGQHSVLIIRKETPPLSFPSLPIPSCDILKWLPVLKIHERDQLSVNGRAWLLVALWHFRVEPLACSDSTSSWVGLGSRQGAYLSVCVCLCQTLKTHVICVK